MLNVNELIGFGIGGAVEALSFTYIGSAQNTSGSDESMDVTSLSVQVGDFLILQISVTATVGVNSGNGTKTGWTRHAFGAVSANAAHLCFSKVADSGDLTTIVGDLTGTTVDGSSSRTVVHVYRPNRAITETATEFDSTWSGVAAGNHPAVVKAASSYAAPNFVVAHYAASGAIDPRTMTGASTDFNFQHSLSTTHAFRGLVQNTSPADITIDMDDEGANNRFLSTGIYFV